MDLTRDQPIPVYYQLKTLLTEEILSGVYGTDGRLPTEHELCERFGLSRTPVTHALTDLAAEGVVLRRRRHGTFVNPHWLARRADSSEVRVLMPTFDRWEPHLRMSSPGVRLSVAQTELNDLHAVFVRAVAEGRAPDLAILDSVWVAEFAASGFLWPLEELDSSWVENDARRDFLEPFVDAHRIGDRTLAVQAEMDVAGMWYERAAIGADGPRTWAELKNIGRRLVSARGEPVLVMPAGPAADEFATYCLVALLASNAARVLGPDAVTLDSPASVEAMRLLQTLVDDKVLSTGAVGHERDWPIQMLARGEALMAFGGSYEAPALARSAGLELDALTDTFGFMPVPAGPRGQSSVLVGGFVYCIPRQARQPGSGHGSAQERCRRSRDGAILHPYRADPTTSLRGRGTGRPFAVPRVHCRPARRRGDAAGDPGVRAGFRTAEGDAGGGPHRPAVAGAGGQPGRRPDQRGDRAARRALTAGPLPGPGAMPRPRLGRA